ncbi:MAG: PDZ domain-containing protein [Chromatiaceae bacterium]|nr:MAG: PDZ domain-containing protein [Chromatiaceae bacterium]
MNGFKLSRALFWAAIAFLLVLTGRPLLEHWLLGRNAEPRVVTARGDLAADELATIAIFDAASSAVVFITTEEAIRSPWRRNLTEVRRGTGSGVIWDDRGHVVTNYHVIAEARAARVRLADRRSYSAVLVGVSPEHDLAVLRIGVGPKRVMPLPIGTSHDLRVGQKVFAIGNPFGFDYSLTTGVVSALDRTIPTDEAGEIRRLIQTDAAINPGNSGGPLIDSAGRLIGINTAIFSPSGSFSGIGFAVPVDTINRIVPALIARGRYVRPRIGIYGDDAVAGPILSQLGVEGVLVLRVVPDSAAARAGLVETVVTSTGEILAGDVIQQVDGQPVDSMGELLDLLEGYEIGDEVILGILRSGRSETIGVVLGGAFEGLD